MKKDSKSGKKNSFSHRGNKDTSEMEKRIDDILSGNKDRLTKASPKKIPENEKITTVLPEKETSDEIDEDDTKFEMPNDKIIEEESAEESEKKRVKKHLVFGKKKEKIIDDSQEEQLVDDEDSNLSLPSQDNLDDFKEKYKGRVDFSSIDPTENESIDNGDSGTKKDEKKKFSLWRKKQAKVEENQEEIITESPTNKFGFRVDNMPISELVNKDSSLKLNDSKNKDSEELSSQTKEEEIKIITDTTAGKSQLEHIFFDEKEEAVGWSPAITEKERKELAMPFPTNKKIKPGDVHSEIESENAEAGSDLEIPKEIMQTKSIKLTDLGFSENEWEELDFYPLEENFAYVEILREKESLDKRYFLVEIELNREEQKILDFILDTLSNLGIDASALETQGKESYLIKKVEQIIKEYGIKLNKESLSKVVYYLEKKAIGLEKIDPLMKDPNIEDISCDGANVPLFLYHRTYGSLKSNVEFRSEDELSSFVFKLAQKCGKHISIAEPMLDATMPDGSRIQMTLSDEITAKGSTFTIRKFREDPFSPPDLVEFNTMSAEMVAYMWIAVENGINALIAGGTAAGKTTVLNALSLFIPRESKIVSIEETREINLPHPNWIPGVARSGFGEVVADKIVGEIDTYDLMKAALRQRPEYIIVGEIRGREAYVLFQAMATGHATYSTVHADSAQSLIHRLEGKPINIPRVMLQSLDIVSLHVITRVKNKRARRCKQMIEIIDIDPTTKEILTNEVFRWDPVEDIFIYSGKSYVLERVRGEKDMSREEMTNELRNRKKIIEWMNTKNIREFREVANVVSRYAESPTEVMKQIDEENKK